MMLGLAQPSPSTASSDQTIGGVLATVPDWSREQPRRFWDPSRKLLGSIRCYQKHAGQWNPFSQICRRLAVLRHRFWSMVTGADIPINALIEGGLLIPHPNGIVIHPAAHIGPNGLVFQQVTIGTGGSVPGVPRVGGHVDIGAGAKLLGGIIVGDHAKIGANAVVLCDVPSGATAVGIPARILSRT